MISARTIFGKGISPSAGISQRRLCSNLATSSRADWKKVYAVRTSMKEKEQIDAQKAIPNEIVSKAVMGITHQLSMPIHPPYTAKEMKTKINLAGTNKFLKQMEDQIAKRASIRLTAAQLQGFLAMDQLQKVELLLGCTKKLTSVESHLNLGKHPDVLAFKKKFAESHASDVQVQTQVNMEKILRDIDMKGNNARMEDRINMGKQSYAPEKVAEMTDEMCDCGFMNMTKSPSVVKEAPKRFPIANSSASHAKPSKAEGIVSHDVKRQELSKYSDSSMSSTMEYFQKQFQNLRIHNSKTYAIPKLTQKNSLDDRLASTIPKLTQLKSSTMEYFQKRQYKQQQEKKQQQRSKQRQGNEQGYKDNATTSPLFALGGFSAVGAVHAHKSHKRTMLNANPNLPPTGPERQLKKMLDRHKSSMIATFVISGLCYLVEPASTGYQKVKVASTAAVTSTAVPIVPIAAAESEKTAAAVTATQNTVLDSTNMFLAISFYALMAMTIGMD